MSEADSVRLMIGKRLRYGSHADFLQKCLDSSVIPKGFQFKWDVQLDVNQEERDKCTRVKTDAALKLMQIARDACVRKANELRTEIDNSALKFHQDCDYIDKFVSSETVKLAEQKAKKWRSLTRGCMGQTQQQRYKITNIVKDGNCFYRCLSQHMYGTQLCLAEVRRDIVKHMYAHAERYSALIDGDVEAHIHNQMHSDGRVSSWATEAEIQAAADWFGITIEVSLGREFTTWSRFVSEINREFCDANPVSINLLLENSHFSLVSDTYHRPVLPSCNTSLVHDWFDNPTISLAENRIHNGKRNLVCDNVKSGPANGKPNIVEKVISDTDMIVTRVPEINCTMSGMSGTVRPSRNELFGDDDNFGSDHTQRLKKKKEKYCKPKRLNTSGQISAPAKASINYPVVSVTNLSNHKLTKAQKSLLEKGLKFIPSRNKIDKLKLLSDLAEWERRMRLHEYFYEKENNHDENQDVRDKFRVKTKKHFTPDAGRDRHLDLYIELVKNDIVDNLKRSGSLNISKDEQQAFYDLLHNKDIVIRPADKGSGIVVVNRGDYIRSLEEEMEKSSSYSETKENLVDQGYKKVKKLVNSMYRNGAISSDMKEYLIPRYVEPGKLKGNPKLHKTGAPYRTIVSGINTATERLAEVAEYELNEYVENSPSYIRDTTHFLQQLKQIPQPLPENSILFCFDVCKLYPSVPRLEGLAACREALETRSDPLIDSENVFKMIETVLENNVFNFGVKQYIQTEGVAIGSRLGKNFACAYMRKWDEKLMEFDQKPLFYKRFIDDGFGIWTGSVEELKLFTSFANNIHDNIKVELRWDDKQLEFLDTLVKLENGLIYTDLYVKPTDKQLYLNNKSCHPPSTKKGLAYGLGLRIRRICEKEPDYLKQRNNLKKQLRKRGYPGKLIENQLSKVDKLRREDLLQVRKCKPSKKSNRVPLVMTFSNLLPDVHKIIHKHIRVLHRSDRMKEVFDEPPIVAFRRDKNLCDTLVHGKTNKAIKVVGTSACKANCELCGMISDHPIMDTMFQTSFNVVCDVHCELRNVVYAISCKRCNSVVYVGETERQLKERMKEHLRDVRLDKDKPINEHFSRSGHSHTDLQFSVLKKMYSADRIERRLNESAWIQDLKTLRPFGCNVKDARIHLTSFDVHQ